MKAIKTAKINGKKIYAFKSKHQLLDFICDKKSILVALNAEKLNKKVPRLDRLINQNIGYADGIGAVWALKKKGINSIKIAGAELWLDIIKKYQETKSFYLVGASEEVIKKTVDKLFLEYPRINIKGFRNGYLKGDDKDNLVKDILEKKPDMVFIAMGSPAQEYVMAEFLKKHEALYMGLGGSFDVYSGTKKRAPALFIKLGIEWLYRLIKEPTRLSRQFSLVKFFFKIIFDKI
ncbi:Lipopolysaccharide N-acetylmannosaminouronosyltransferase [Flagellimonas maritima]|uniref:Lipopolysaccharide N-acetylmannosaminouronosyltransferase n=1 Tax=Flagellimonas maritima TaxID=1383885 RepID=A0A2Z4LRL5_9FLAO|nr:WecB/TagA/CpsF family glycosyltransferase [Allomuricauda aurantiaca]AWX44551.1 Lipopolysaccharide N-acetylmannosaminouronosyltransferase [Allomuricauda aurantiaca]